MDRVRVNSSLHRRYDFQHLHDICPGLEPADLACIACFKACVAALHGVNACWLLLDSGCIRGLLGVEGATPPLQPTLNRRRCTPTSLIHLFGMLVSRVGHLVYSHHQGFVVRFDLRYIRTDCKDSSLQDTWEGLSRAVEKGLVRSIGVSNHSPEKIQAWLRGVRIPVSVNQVTPCYLPVFLHMQMPAGQQHLQAAACFEYFWCMKSLLQRLSTCSGSSLAFSSCHPAMLTVSVVIITGRITSPMAQ